MARMTIKSSAAQIVGAFVLMLAYAPVVFCQTEDVQKSEIATSEVREEITVYGRNSLVNLRRALDTAEDNFFAVFNSLNSDDEYDVDCGRVFSLEAHRRLRICKAKFLMRYESEFGKGWNPNLAVLRKKEKLLVDEMRTQVSEHPELLEVFTELAKSKGDYDSERQSRRKR